MDDKKIHGNTTGISNAMLQAMQGMYDIRLPKTVFLTEELAHAMAKYSCETNREISILISRDGVVQHIGIGDFDRVETPQLATRRSQFRLSGIRCIHTHPGGSGRLSGVDYATLNSAKLDAMAAIGVKNNAPVDLFAAFLTGDAKKHHTIGPLGIHEFGSPVLMQALQHADQSVGREQTHDLKKTQEYAVLVGSTPEGMEELQELAATAGAKVVASEVQSRPAPDRATYIGRGKAKDLSLLVTQLDADLVIINAEITPIQQRNLEEYLGVKVVDRTALILDIFAMRAKSKEGRLQVELAQMKYLLPRLIGQGMVLSRQAAAAGGMGIASRGPGETKLELDRRHIRRRIHILEQEIKQLEKQREQRRSRREASGTPIVALVGYTNAGKSTLLNALTGAEAYTEDKLFATLDPLSRRTDMKGKEVIFTDTVGFVQNLPHSLVDAFHSTLEEVTYADVLIHVVDGSDPEMRQHMEVVGEVLGSLGAADTPTITVFNKTDVAEGPVPVGMIALSARKHQGIDLLENALDHILSHRFVRGTLHLPYSRSDLASTLHEHGTVLSEDYRDEEMVFDVELPAALMKRIKSELHAPTL